MKLLIFLGLTIGSYAGWWLGEQISDDFTWAVVLSGVGTFVGAWLGWKLARNIEE